MKITFSYLAQLRLMAGRVSDDLELTEPCTLAGLLQSL
jgi:hypothetical protein